MVVWSILRTGLKFYKNVIYSNQHLVINLLLMERSKFVKQTILTFTEMDERTLADNSDQDLSR